MEEDISMQDHYRFMTEEILFEAEKKVSREEAVSRIREIVDGVESGSLRLSSDRFDRD